MVKANFVKLMLFYRKREIVLHTPDSNYTHYFLKEPGVLSSCLLGPVHKLECFQVLHRVEISNERGHIKKYQYAFTSNGVHVVTTCVAIS